MSRQYSLKKVCCLLVMAAVGGTSFVSAQSLTIQDLFTQYYNYVGQDIPDSRKYIEVKYHNIDKSSDFYQSLQKAVYLNILPNTAIKLPRDTPATEQLLQQKIHKDFGLTFNYQTGKILQQKTLDAVLSQITPHTSPKAMQGVVPLTKNPSYQKFVNIYGTLTQLHIQKDSFISKTLFDGAIKGLIDEIHDPYTDYFPADESQDFTDSLKKEYEGIGAYIEIQTGNTLIITSPIIGSPAIKAGIQAGDQIIQVDTIPITATMDVNTAIRHIKGPSGTDVILKIKRKTKIIDITVTRGIVDRPILSYKKLPGQGQRYISLSLFTDGIAQDFTNLIKSLADQGPINGVIIDVRNNPGGSLAEVSKILAHFVPYGQDTVAIKGTNSFVLTVDKKIDPSLFLGDKKITFLINSRSASASEILVATTKEYAPQTVIKGTTSYGKGTVQSVYNYKDGSTLKLTTAKRYTGKYKKSIDQKGIDPDSEALMVQ